MSPTEPLDESSSPDAALDRLLRRDRRAELNDRVRQLWHAARARTGWVVAVCLVLGAAVVAWALLSGRGDPPELTLPTAPSPGAVSSSSVGSSVAGSSTSVAGEVVAHVTGAVNRAGLVRLRAGARVADALDAAGGPTADADVDRVNLAEPLIDGSRVVVPRVGEALLPPVSAVTPPGDAAASGPPGGDGDATPDAPIDLNTADAAELERLPGVGPSTAKAIVDHRTEHGPFRSVDDLLDVRGIGPAKLEALRDVATAGG